MGYIYEIPEGVKISVEYREIGYRFGKRIILVNERIQGWDKYFVKEVERGITKKVEKPEPATKEYTRDDLENMKYKELVKVAKELGIKDYRVRKKELIDKILDATSSR